MASSLSLADPRSGSNTFVWFPHMHSKELQPFGLLGELWWSWQEASVLPAVTALGIVSEAFVALLGPTVLMVFLFSLHLVLNCMFVYVCVFECVCLCVHRAQKRVWDLSELELQMVMSHLIRVLGTKLWSFARPVHTCS